MMWFIANISIAPRAHRRVGTETGDSEPLYKGWKRAGTLSLGKLHLDPRPHSIVF